MNKEGEEIWSNIESWPEYQISNFGNVRSYKRGGEAKKIMGSSYNGYIFVRFSMGKYKRYYKVHRLVAIAFIPNPKNLPQVNHIDGNKSNNHISNLEWVDALSNQRHAVRLGLIAYGERASRTKLTEKQVLDILKCRNSRSVKINDLAKKYSVDRTVITNITSGKTWNRTWKNFHGYEA